MFFGKGTERDEERQEYRRAGQGFGCEFSNGVDVGCLPRPGRGIFGIVPQMPLKSESMQIFSWVTDTP